MDSLRRIVLVLIVATMGAGCTTAPQSPKEAGTICEKTEQLGCIEIDVLNLAWDSVSPMLKGLDKPPASITERYRRATKLGPELYRGFKDGTVKASRERSFLVFLWNTKGFDEQRMASYSLDYPTLTKGKVEEVFDAVPPVSDPVSHLGTPRVFRIHARGKVPVGAALQIPWSVVTERTYVLVCSEDRLAVYPNRITAKDGLWISPDSLGWMKERGKVFAVLPFLSRD